MSQDQPPPRAPPPQAPPPQEQQPSPQRPYDWQPPPAPVKKGRPWWHILLIVLGSLMALGVLAVLVLVGLVFVVCSR